MWIQSQMMHEKTDRLKTETFKFRSVERNRASIGKNFWEFSIGRASIRHQSREAESFEHKASQVRSVEGDF